MWPFRTIITGGPVHINCGPLPPEDRKARAETRVANLTAKLGRLESRDSTRNMKQEVANTITAISAWRDIMEMAVLELKQQKRRSQS